MDQEKFNSSPSIRAIVGLVLILAAFTLMVSVLAYSFSHPDMTQTRVFLNTWPVIIAAILFFVVGGIVRSSADD